ncbi:MAG: hypothetical protein QOI41_5046 [Myxococcales bacterium]|jgi:hypothetical protein|nr:hypothetical protein [Myxococcales bacterium]
MRRILRAVVAYFVASMLALAIVLVTSAAFADDAPSARVEDLKKRGNQAMLDLNYGEALDAYTAAIAIAPDDATLYYNLGRAHQAREDYPAALDALDQFARKATPEVKARVPKLEQLIGDVRSRVGTLSVQCSAEVSDATVSIGDKTTLQGCSTAPKVVRVSVPSRTAVLEVRLSAERFQSQSARVAVEGGGPVVGVLLSVLAKASSGTLLVRATPLDARISVDGIERGNPPLEVPLPAGAHTLDVRADRHDPSHVPVVVEAGRTKDVSIDLQRSAPITTKWWFWTGLGVLAVGVGVTVWYLVAQPEKDASSGTIAPGQVSAPLVSF